MGEGWAFTGGSSEPVGHRGRDARRGPVVLRVRPRRRHGGVGDPRPDRQRHPVRATTWCCAWTATASSPSVSRPIGPHAATFVTRRKPHAGLADSTLLVVRNRYVGNGIVEDVTVENLSREAVELTLSLRVGADFADLFEVKEGRAAAAPGVHARPPHGVVSSPRRATGPGRRASPGPAGRPTAPSSPGTWPARARPRRPSPSASKPSVDGDPPAEPPYPVGSRTSTAAPRVEHAEWRRSSPRLRFRGPAVRRAPRAPAPTTSARLRIFDPEHPDRVVLAAGAPWFMTLFGRDSLLTSLDGAPARRRARPRARCTRSPTARAPTVDPHDRGGAGPDPARDPLRAVGAARARRRTASTTAPSTPRRCSSCCSASCAAGASPATRSTALLPHADRALDWIERLRRPRRRRLRRVRARHRPRAWSTRAGRTPGTAITLRRRPRSPTPRSRWPRCRATSTPRYLARAAFAEDAGDHERAAG